MIWLRKFACTPMYNLVLILFYCGTAYYRKEILYIYFFFWSVRLLNEEILRHVGYDLLRHGFKCAKYVAVIQKKV